MVRRLRHGVKEKRYESPSQLLRSGRLAEKLWAASRKKSRQAQTIILKLKRANSKIHTRSYAPERPPGSCEELTDIRLKLTERVDISPQQGFPG